MLMFSYFCPEWVVLYHHDEISMLCLWRTEADIYTIHTFSFISTLGSYCFLQALPDIAWGKRSRVILDVGCGVASFGGYMFERDVLTMSFAPKDEHEAQVQFALERGIPAISAVMGTKRLPYPSRVFDVIHCARCRVPWHIEGLSCWWHYFILYFP